MLKFITCSGVNEHTDIKQLMTLLEEFPRAEIAVQVSEKKCFHGSPRMAWIYALQEYLRVSKLSINAALHVNLKWVEAFAQGSMVAELYELLKLKDVNGLPFFKRVQLNFKVGREEVPHAHFLYDMMRRYYVSEADGLVFRRRFILPYNNENQAIVHDLYRSGLSFDLLYDSSFGAGIVPTNRPAPVFPDVDQGYAGGIAPHNVAEVLTQIQCSVGKFYQRNVFIDAQKGLEDEQTHIDLNKCHQYLQNAENWCAEH